MSGIFISHRHSDAATASTKIHEGLQDRFGDKQVFYDVEDMVGGDRFRERIEEAVVEADVLVAIVGPNWLTLKDANGSRRLDLPGDLVVEEIATALEHGIRVVPVMVDGAGFVKEDAPLPKRIWEFADLHFEKVSPDSFEDDLAKLIIVLERILDGGESSSHSKTGRLANEHETLGSSVGPGPSTVSFLFTDIEGSTGLWEQHLEAMRLALANHDDLLQTVIEGHGGRVFSHAGDGLAAAFASPKSAVMAAIDGQQKLMEATWGEIGQLSVRMALHTGAEQQRDGNFFGPTLNRASRLLELASGGQILLSRATQEMVHDRLPPGAHLEDLGTHNLRSLSKSEHVFQLTHDEFELSVAPLRVRTAVTTLPAPLTSFIGRRQDVARVRELLLQSRVVTITGAGGTGKTRLAIEVGRSIQDRYPAGVRFVSLDSVVDEQFVVKRIAEVLGVRERPSLGILETIIRELLNEQLLLILDNCEHVIETASQAVSSIVRSCRNVTVMATSREELSVDGEVEHRLEGLPTAVSEDSSLAELGAIESIRLFVDRAAAVKPTFAITDENAMEIALLCAQLDGIPLAIELAAVRANALSPSEIMEALGEHLNVFRSRSRTGAARHETIDATIQWSYGLLPEEQQRMFVRLAILEGTFTMEAAEAIATDGNETDAFDDVLELVAKSLLTPTKGHDVRARYRMLTMLRQFGRERLREWNEFATYASRHARYFLEIAEHAALDLQGPDQQHARDQLEQEHDNLRAALDWSVASGDRETAGRLAIALRWFWYWGGHINEGYTSMEMVRNLLVDRRDDLLASLLVSAAVLADVRGDLESASRDLALALELSRELAEPALTARALVELGVVAKDHGRLDEAEGRFEESMSIDRSIGEDGNLVIALRFSGETAYLRGDLELAEGRLSEARELAVRLGRDGEVAWVATHVGELLHRSGRLDESRIQLEEASELHESNSYARGVAWTQVFLGTLFTETEDRESARSPLESALDAFRDINDRRGTSYALVALSALSLAEGDHSSASNTAAEAIQTAEAIGDVRAVAWGRMVSAASARRESRLDHGQLKGVLESFVGLGDREGTVQAVRLVGRALADGGEFALGIQLVAAADAALPAGRGGTGLYREMTEAVADTGIDGAAAWQSGLDTDLGAALSMAADALA